MQILKNHKVFRLTEKTTDKTSYTPEEKRCILEALNARRKREEKEKKSHRVPSENQIVKKTKYTEEEKRRILEELNARRKREQKARESIRAYLSDKKIYLYKGKSYYKVKDYKQSFYILKETMNLLADTVCSVELERSGYTANRRQKGFIKWDMSSKRILISLSNVRVYYKPFEIEKA